MKSAFAFTFTVLLSTVAFAQNYTCMPAHMTVDRVADAVAVSSSSGVESIHTVTIGQKLKKLKAKCRRGKLVDFRNRQVRFYELQGCWGNPPVDHQEILEQQTREIADLRKKYSVIEITCNPRGLPIY